MKISIIVPVYNGERTIMRCLNSIYNQGLHNGVEVIVVNDCSTDRTRSILENTPPFGVI